MKKANLQHQKDMEEEWLSRLKQCRNETATAERHRDEIHQQMQEEMRTSHGLRQEVKALSTNISDLQVIPS